MRNGATKASTVTRTWRLRAGMAGVFTGVLATLLLATLSAGIRGAEAKATTAEQARLLEDVKYLASDQLQGRGVGTEGLDAAAQFIRDEFHKAGLKVEAADQGFQKFTMVTGAELGSPNTLAFQGPDEKTIPLEFDADFQTCSFGGSGELDHELVFLGYGIEGKEEGYNDFEGIDVKGKVAIIMRRVPQQANPYSPFTGGHGGISRHAELRTKVSNAFGKGAVAVLFVNDPYTLRTEAEQAVEKAQQRVVAAARKLVEARNGDDESRGEGENADQGQDSPKSLEELQKALEQAVANLKTQQARFKKGPEDPLMPFGYGGRGTDETLPVAHISRAVCDDLLQASLNQTLAEIETVIDQKFQPYSRVLDGWRVTGALNVKRIRTEVKNVIGVLEGSGPQADETIVIGAHYDHVGMGGEGSLARGSKAVHNGADDNASGTASLIELARRLAGREQKLPRRLVFIAFTAEELGLIGSARYVKEPVFPLDQTIAMFNMDMVGRMEDNKLTVFGSGTAERWEPLVSKAAEAQNIDLTLKPEGFGPSDHSSFYAKQIPVLHFFTGTHSDYHRPSDDWDKINVDGMQRVVDMLESLIVQTAQTAERPQYVAVQGRGNIMRSGNRPYFGSIPDFGGEVEGYAISGVSPGSPAAKAGLQGGDSIVRFGGSKIGSLDDFDLALRKFSAGDQVEVVVIRNGEEKKFTVKLAKPK